MVKRVKTPEPGNDEPKYFTVVQPYPLHANWEYDQDYITCARWLAGALGSDAPLYAIFHKPSARGMILIEVEKTYNAQIIRERLLGEHKWEDFLVNPSEEERGRRTQIFYSFYSIGREAQKDGWKRIHVEQHFFNEWNINNNIIRQPYPRTEWCPPPQEDITNKPMCRPIPRDHPTAPKPAVAPKPVVGSSQWAESKSATQPTSQKTKLSATATAFNPGGKMHAISKKPQLPEANVAPKSAWVKPITAKPAPPKSVWGKPAASSSAAPASPPGLPPPPGLTRDISSASSLGPPTPTVSSLTEEFATFTMSPSLEANLNGTAADLSPDLMGANYISDFEKFGYDSGLAYETYAVTSHDSQENLWASDPAPAKKKEEDQVVCPIHRGKECKKGICDAYHKALREHEKKKRQASGGKGPGKPGRQGSGGPRGRNTDSEGFTKVRSVSRTTSGGSSRAASVVNEENPWGF